MIRFENDYNHGAHPAILEALSQTNETAYGGYGLDEWCEKGAKEIRKYLDCPEADIHYMVGGTQVNFTVITAALRPYQSVLSADTGHIHVHETGAAEHIGHKVQALPSANGKITAAQVAQAAGEYACSGIREHITQPKMVYLSFPTEYGTLYSRQELEEISDVCREYGMYLYVDGARLGYAIGSPKCDITLRDLANLTDLFYIGGTKCGALFGEAVVIINPALKPDFRSYIKQSGGMLAKGWLLGLQFYTLFKNGLYFDITKAAVSQAIQIREAFAQKGIFSYIDSPTNQQFFVVENRICDILAQKYVFQFDHKADDTHSVIRFCTSWSTTEDAVNTLLADIRALPENGCLCSPRSAL